MIIKIHVSFFVPPILFSNNKRSKFTFIILYYTYRTQKFH